MAKKSKGKAKKKISMSEWEGSSADTAIDKKAVAKANKKGGSKAKC